MSQEQNNYEEKPSEALFNDRTLAEWEIELTLVIPNLPCSSLKMNDTLASLSNKFQIAFNMYIRALTLSSKAERDYKLLKYKLVNEIIQEYETKKVARIPPVEKLETIVFNKEENSRLRELAYLKEKYELFKIFFENNKTKLDKMIPLLRDIAYTTNQADRNQHKPSI